MLKWLLWMKGHQVGNSGNARQGDMCFYMFADHAIIPNIRNVFCGNDMRSWEIVL